TPNPGFGGRDQFSYTISDGHGGSASATVTVQVAVALSQISISPAPTASVIVGSTVAFTARGIFTDSSVQEPLLGIACNTGTPGVATIDGNGVATCKALGETRIRASRDGIQSPETTLTVVAVMEPPSITGFSPSSGRVGDTVTINGANLVSASGVG